MARIIRLNDAFSGIFELEASPVKVNQCSKKLRKAENKKKGERKSTKACRMPEQNLLKHHVSGKKGIPSCCKCIFE